MRSFPGGSQSALSGRTGLPATRHFVTPLLRQKGRCVLLQGVRRYSARLTHDA